MGKCACTVLYFNLTFCKFRAVLYCLQDKFHPPILFLPFDQRAGLIELYVKDYVRKLESGQIQNWVNQSENYLGQKYDWAKLYIVYYGIVLYLSICFI